MIQQIVPPSDKETTRLPIPVVKDNKVGRMSEVDSNSPCIVDEIGRVISGLKVICLRVRTKIFPSLIMCIILDIYFYLNVHLSMEIIRGFGRNDDDDDEESDKDGVVCMSIVSDLSCTFVEFLIQVMSLCLLLRTLSLVFSYGKCMYLSFYGVYVLCPMNNVLRCVF